MTNFNQNLYTVISLHSPHFNTKMDQIAYSTVQGSNCRGQINYICSINNFEWRKYAYFERSFLWKQKSESLCCLCIKHKLKSSFLNWVITGNVSAAWVIYYPLMRFFFLPLSIITLLASCLHLGLTYCFHTPIRIEGNIHLICGLTQPVVVLSIPIQTSQIDRNVLLLITGSKVLLGCLVLWRISQSLFLWVIFPVFCYIQSLPVIRLNSYGHSTAPDYVSLIICSFTLDCQCGCA